MIHNYLKNKHNCLLYEICVNTDYSKAVLFYCINICECYDYIVIKYIFYYYISSFILNLTKYNIQEINLCNFHYLFLVLFYKFKYVIMKS